EFGAQTAGGLEPERHAPGRSPPWWRGKRFDRPITAWACGTTGETTRDTVQRILVGRPDARGTGAIPKECLAELVPARGVADLLDAAEPDNVRKDPGAPAVGRGEGRDRSATAPASGRKG